VKPQPLPRSEAILSQLCDIRLPLGLSDAQADILADVVLESLNEALI